MISQDECATLLAEFNFNSDVRKFPDNLRKGQFRKGWHRAVKGKKGYTASTLNRLTWNNLGYRMGQRYGTKNLQEVVAAYEQFALHYQTTQTPFDLIVESEGDSADYDWALQVEE